MSEPKYIVGIDLGTTHTVVAACQRSETEATVEVVPVPQYLSRTEVGPSALLPSFLYAPLDNEPFEDRWGTAPWVLGHHAQKRGQETAGRLVQSAKSWLCHGAVDREAAILPWGLDDDDGAPRLSPVEASRLILLHVAKAWDHAHPDAPLSKQRVVLTVPASFDQVARELTLRAAVSAGLEVRLLEEPQAAFYDLLSRQGTAPLSRLLRGDGKRALVLVCDIGGGTTDLTLISIAQQDDGAPSLTRIAVGHHLLLGGDNMDLALAHLAESRLITGKERLDPVRFGQLVLQCRAAKERLLAEDGPEAVRVTVLGRGSQLLGSGLSTDLTRAEAEQIVLDGFLPAAPKNARPKPRRGGLVAFGLPYESDPAITRHLAWFFSRHAPADEAPRALLLNGGLFRSPRIRARLLEALRAWTEGELELLEAEDPDLAVARGAVAYGRALDGQGPRIGGGAPHGYYVGLGGDQNQAVCVVPKGAQEGERALAQVPALTLLTGRAVRFDLYASDDSAVHAPGQIVELEADRFRALPPVSTRFDDSSRKEVRVSLEGELTPLGTLDLACVDQADPSRRFKLHFELRSNAEARKKHSEPAPSRRSLLPGDTRFEPAAQALRQVFGKGQGEVKPREVKNLIRELERHLGERAGWTMETNRALFDVLVEAGIGSRRRSSDHERVFWQLAGFCLRPGFGHPDDPPRRKLLLPAVRDGLIYREETRNWQQLWIAWRRIAGGLPEDMQLSIRDLVDPFIAPAEERLKKPKKVKPKGPAEMLDLAGTLERVPVERKTALGRWLLEQTWSSRDPRIWAALGRVGARCPAYGSVHLVVPRKNVEDWLDHLLREKWSEVPTAPRAAMLMARLSGDRARDISAATRKRVALELERAGANPEWIRAINEVVEIDDQERAEFFGADLPRGLTLAD